MTTTPTPTSGAAIKRYKIGYREDEWGQRSSTPSGIQDASGSWVRYEDHIAALAAGQATAAQQGAAYAVLPTSSHAGRVYEEGFLIGTCPLYNADQLRAFADATHTLRASHGLAPAETGNSVSARADSVQEDANCAWSNDELTAIYNEANGITVKNPPITTERIFAAMRRVAQIAARAAQKQGEKQ